MSARDTRAGLGSAKPSAPQLHGCSACQSNLELTVRLAMTEGLSSLSPYWARKFVTSVISTLVKASSCLNLSMSNIIHDMARFRKLLINKT